MSNMQIPCQLPRASYPRKPWLRGQSFASRGHTLHSYPSKILVLVGYCCVCPAVSRSVMQSMQQSKGEGLCIGFLINYAPFCSCDWTQNFWTMFPELKLHSTDPQKQLQSRVWPCSKERISFLSVQKRISDLYIGYTSGSSTTAKNQMLRHSNQ